MNNIGIDTFCNVLDIDYLGFHTILKNMITKPLKRFLMIEIWDEKEFYDYFKLPEMTLILKADKQYRPIEGIYMLVKKNVRGIAILYNDNFLSTTVHEITHAVDFDKFPDWLYRLIHKKWIKKFRKYDPFEKRAWKNELKFMENKNHGE